MTSKQDVLTSMGISTATCKALSDKIYEKRKMAAFEIERLIRQLHVGLDNSIYSIKHDACQDDSKELDVCKQTNLLISCLINDFLLNPSCNARKGGLISLASVAIALEHFIKPHLSMMISPILVCFSDQDAQVRYYACEAIYNVVKVAGVDALCYLNELLEGSMLLCSDVDSDVRQGLQYLDRLLKDIVIESPTTHWKELVPLLSKRGTTTNPYVRQHVLSWIVTLHSVPNHLLLVHLTSLLRNLFRMLLDKNKDICHTADACLASLCEGLKSLARPIFEQNDEDDIKKFVEKYNIEGMIKILVEFISSEVDRFACYTALIWVESLITCFGRSPPPAFLVQIPTLLESLLGTLSHKDQEIADVAQQVNVQLFAMIHANGRADTNEDILNTLLYFLPSDNDTAHLCVLDWLVGLLELAPDCVLAEIETVLTNILQSLKHRNPKIVDKALILLGRCAAQETVFDRVCAVLLTNLETDQDMLRLRGRTTLRFLCRELRPDVIFKSLASATQNLENIEFAHQLVQVLSWMLLTSKETEEYRKSLWSDKTSLKMLLEAWVHNPIATLALCLWAREYRLASRVTLLLGQLELSQDAFLQLDQLIYLLESPIFTPLRLELLDGPRYLVDTLIAVAMLIPQSTGFNVLMNRIRCAQQCAAVRQPSWDNISELRPESGTLANSEADCIMELLLKTVEKHKRYVAKMPPGSLSPDDILTSLNGDSFPKQS